MTIGTFLVGRDPGDENDYDVYRELGRGNRWRGKRLVFWSMYGGLTHELGRWSCRESNLRLEDEKSSV